MNYFEILRNDKTLAKKVFDFCDFYLTDELCPLDPLRNETTNEPFLVFGRDGSGGEFGFIGKGDLDSLSIGYVGTEGEAGRIAENLDDFFRLLIYCPFWQDVLHYLPLEANNNEARFKAMSGKEFTDSYNTDEQAEIAAKLGLGFEQNTMRKFYDALTREPKFKIFADDGNEYDDLLPQPRRNIPAPLPAESVVPTTFVKDGWNIKPFEGINDIRFGITREDLKDILGESENVTEDRVMSQMAEYWAGIIFVFKNSMSDKIYKLCEIIVSEQISMFYDGIDLFHQNDAVGLLLKRDTPVMDKKGYFAMFPNLGLILGGFEGKKVPASDLPKITKEYSEFSKGKIAILFSKERARFYQIFMGT